MKRDKNDEESMFRLEYVQDKLEIGVSGVDIVYNHQQTMRMVDYMQNQVYQLIRDYGWLQMYQDIEKQVDELQIYQCIC